jgi:hypothetical protein
MKLVLPAKQALCRRLHKALHFRLTHVTKCRVRFYLMPTIFDSRLALGEEFSSQQKNAIFFAPDH